MFRSKILRLFTLIIFASMLISVIGLFSSCENEQGQPQIDKTTDSSDTTESEVDDIPERYLYKHVVIVGV